MIIFILWVRGANEHARADFGLWPGHTPLYLSPTFLLEHYRKCWLVQTPSPTRSTVLIMGKLNKHPPPPPPSISSVVPEIKTLWEPHDYTIITIAHEKSYATVSDPHLSHKWSLLAPAWSSLRLGRCGAVAPPSWLDAQRVGRDTLVWSLEEGTGCWALTSACGRWAGHHEPSLAGRGTCGMVLRADVEIYGNPDSSGLIFRQKTIQNKTNKISK